jgi:hypothetical protein
MTSEVVIASQRVGAKRRPMTGSAKQSIAQQKGRMDCFAALAMTVKHDFAISPHSMREVLVYFPPFSKKGRRECRAADAPDSRVCNGSG